MSVGIYNIVLLIIFLLFFVHWFSTLILCLQKQKSNKIFWFTIIFLTFPIGQFYFRIKNNHSLIWS
jgi:hypothetical protein